MISNNIDWNSPVRSIKARVEMYESSTRVSTFASTDKLKSITIEKVGEESKFFGFGICQKINLHLIDKDREVNNITTANSFTIGFSDDSNTYSNFHPKFHVTEVHRNENTNELSITAYDKLYAVAEHTVSELRLVAPYTIRNVAEAISALMGTSSVKIIGITGVNPFDIVYTEGANFEGTETIREALNAIAEATQTVYYIDNFEKLVFKRLSVDGNPVLTISKEDYITLDSKTNRRLTSVVSATELGDNIGASLEQTGTTQYVRDNPFWELREDIATLVENALSAVGELTINQFDCSWRGNPTLEPGDKINMVTKDNDVVTSFVLNDTLTYDGGLFQQTKWSYTDSAETASNPTTLGEVLKKTYAKVDKANQEIEIVAGEAAAIKLTTDTINASVSKIDNDVSELTNEVNAKMSAEDVSISIQTALGEGVERVTTATGFTFNEEGLHISKTDSKITTNITENGMAVYRDNDEVLTADNLGVKAEDLHATTFLIIGNNSRLEDYDGSRTGCFWIGN